MSDALTLLLLTVAAGLLLAIRKTPVELVALALLTGLILTGLISPAEAFTGFSHPAIILVASFLIISEAMARTGVVSILTRALFRTLAPRRILALMMGSSAIFSAWISNTAITALFIPMIKDVARDKGIPSSRLLLPLSYSAIIGGSLTVVGSSTNLFGASLYRDFTGDGIHVFALLPFAVLFFFAWGSWMLIRGHRHLPEKSPAEGLLERIDLRDFLVQGRVEEGSSLIGKPVKGDYLLRTHDIEIVAVERRRRRHWEIPDDMTIQAGDRILFRGAPESVDLLGRILKISFDQNLTIQKAGHANGRVVYVEAILGPNSRFVNRKVGSIGVFDKLGGHVLGVARRGRSRVRRVRDILLRFGDILVIQGPPGIQRALAKSKDFIVRQEIQLPVERRKKLPYSLAALVIVLLLALTGALPLHAAAFVGAVFVVLAGCLTPGEMRSAINIKVLILIASLIPFAIVFTESGLAGRLAELIAATGGQYGPRGALLTIILGASLLAHIIHPNGVLAVMIPLAVATGQTLGVDTLPFAISVIYAAVYSFLSPFAYNTNAMVTAEAGYEFKDFLRNGIVPLILFYLLAFAFIPVIFPFA